MRVIVDAMGANVMGEELRFHSHILRPGMTRDQIDEALAIDFEDEGMSEVIDVEVTVHITDEEWAWYRENHFTEDVDNRVRPGERSPEAQDAFEIAALRYYAQTRPERKVREARRVAAAEKAERRRQLERFRFRAWCYWMGYLISMLALFIFDVAYIGSAWVPVMFMVAGVANALWNENRRLE